MFILERYIIRNHIGPFFFSLSILTFIFIMDFVLRYIDPFLKKGIAFHVVLQVFFLSLGHMFALIIPMAVLPATLMAFGNLTSENEVTAMKANGISLLRMIAPGLMLASVLAVGMILYNNHLLPESNHKLRNLLVDIYQKKPSIRIKENTFIDEFEGYTIYVRKKNDKTGEIRDVQIFKNKKGSIPTTIVAEKGKLEYLEQQHTLRFELENVEIHEMPVANDASTYRKTTSKHYTMSIEDVDRSLQRTEREYRGDREMSVRQMNERILGIQEDIDLVNLKMNQTATRQIRETLALMHRPAAGTGARDADSVSAAGGSVHASPKPPPASIPRAKLTGGAADFDESQRGRKEYVTYKALESQRDIRASYFKQIDRYKVEIYKKFSIPFACIVFVLIGAPIALRTGRTGMNTAIGLSISFFLIYYVCLIGGEKLADRDLIHPFIAMWGANIVCGLAGLVLLRGALREERTFAWDAFDPRRIFARSHDASHTR
jgi:lipopolysaccharide export system permease protein